ncbi:MAG: hypothetical protein ACSHX3_01910 [Litorimonas sp.]
MILRRLSTAVRKQDWFTVAVETLIVVLGVFIGLQVNNWNSARGDQQRESRYMERLAQDFVSIQDRIERGIQADDNSSTSCSIALHAINIANGEQDGPLPTDEVLFGAVEYCGDNIRPPGTSATLQEMIASGAFARLSNERLRTLLYEFDQSVEMFDGSYEASMRRAFDVEDGVLYDIWRFEVHPVDGDSDETLKSISWDRERVFKDRRVRIAAL